MKTLKTLSILFFSLLTISCSKDDGGDDGGGSGEPAFSASVDGGPFANYSAIYSSYSADDAVGVTFTVFDQDMNSYRFFLNGTGGYGSGTVKEIGNVDSDGFFTNVTVRHDESLQVFMASSDGTITITENVVNDDDRNIISGTFSFMANTNVGVDITVSGTFENFEY